MRRIGLLGGMSWESSVNYERLLNEGVRQRLGGVASADLIVRSYNFAEIEGLQAAGDWDAAGQLLGADARRLADAGAALVLLCTNTMHRVAGHIEDALADRDDVRFLHLADATAAAVGDAGITDVALLGTRYTMEGDFYAGRLEAHGLRVHVPDESDRTLVHDVIYDELVQGRIEPDSRRSYLEVIDRLVAAGAAAVIAGCTEIELLVTAADVSVPYFPTTRLHVERALALAFDD